MTSAWKLVAGLEWLLALAWIGRVASTLSHLGQLPDLLSARFTDPCGVPAQLDGQTSSGTADHSPELAVIVPALNEASSIRECLRSLLASQGIRLEIVAVDDRSTDATGAIMDAVAASYRASSAPSHHLSVVHIEQLPEGWLGKPHALWTGATLATAPLLLFTDADAHFAPDALARACRLMEAEGADHLVLLPTLILKSPGERMMLGLIHALGLWGPRLWRIADPLARDSIGVGCFNLVRRSAFEALGGFASMKMEVVEDLRLGFLVKKHSFRQRVALGPGLLRLHWASGALGIVRGLEKNFFAVCRYRNLSMAVMIGATTVLTLAPWLGLAGPWAVRVPSGLALIGLAAFYRANAKRSRIATVHVLLMPVAALLLLYAMMRSWVLTLARGGVRWRGTFYPLAELRRSAGPLFRL